MTHEEEDDQGERLINEGMAARYLFSSHPWLRVPANVDQNTKRGRRTAPSCMI